MIKMYSVAQHDTIQLQSWKSQNELFCIKFKDLSRISRIAIKFKDFKDFFKDVATLLLYGVALSASVKHPYNKRELSL